MSKYAGQRKKDRDIDKALKKHKSSQKSRDKASVQKKAQYYAKLLNKNKRK